MNNPKFRCTGLGGAWVLNCPWGGGRPTVLSFMLLDMARPMPRALAWIKDINPLCAQISSSTFSASPDVRTVKKG